MHQIVVICPECGTRQQCEHLVSPNDIIRCSACGESFPPARKAYTNQRNNQYKFNGVGGHNPKWFKVLLFAIVILLCAFSGFWCGYAISEEHHPFRRALRVAEKFYAAIHSGSYNQFKGMLDTSGMSEQDCFYRDVSALWYELKRQVDLSSDFVVRPVSRATIRKHKAFVCEIHLQSGGAIAVAVAKVNGQWKIVGISGKSM